MHSLVTWWCRLHVLSLLLLYATLSGERLIVNQWGWVQSLAIGILLSR